MGAVLVFIGGVILWGMVMAFCWPLGLAVLLIVIGLMMSEG